MGRNQEWKFLIINGQHKISSLKELKKGGCGEERKVELSTLDDYIVWTVYAYKHLKVLQSSNHINHAQPTRLIGFKIVNDNYFSSIQQDTL